MKVIILAGGLGTRLQEETTIKPKPMVDIGGRPLLWHIMSIYSAYGFKDFIIASGYKGEVIKNYFLNYYYLRNDFSVCLDSGKIDVHDGKREDWTVNMIDTGIDTQTGGRLKRLKNWISSDTFMLTYGDGVSDIKIDELVAFHQKHGKLATITAVRPPARFGGLSFEGDFVARFEEKPQIGEGWINGGFFVFKPGIFDYIDNDDTLLERAPLEKLAQDGELVAYRHEGFWQSMDTLRDVRLLESLCAKGNPPWRTKK